MSPRVARSADDLRLVLTKIARGRATLAVAEPADNGLFPPAASLSPPPRPVVVDANWFRDELLHVARKGSPTTLLSCAQEQYLRIFVAPHVVLEVLEHAPDWSEQVGVSSELCLRIWRQCYLPLLRVVDPDGAPLTEAESRRVAQLVAVDPDDVPTAALAILLEAPLISRDRAAMEAVYGERAPAVLRSPLLRLLADAGLHGQVSQHAASVAWLAGMTGAGLIGAGRAAARRPLVALAAATAAAWAARSRGGEWWQGLTAVSREVLGYAGVVSEVGRQTRESYDSAKPTTDWTEVVSQHSRRDAITRALVHSLARDGHGEVSAEEAARRLRGRLGGVSATTVRTQLRALTPQMCLEVYRGRWQLGRPFHFPTDSLSPSPVS